MWRPWWTLALIGACCTGSTWACPLLADDATALLAQVQATYRSCASYSDVVVVTPTVLFDVPFDEPPLRMSFTTNFERGGDLRLNASIESDGRPITRYTLAGDAEGVFVVLRERDDPLEPLTLTQAVDVLEKRTFALGLPVQFVLGLLYPGQCYGLDGAAMREPQLGPPEEIDGHPCSVLVLEPFLGDEMTIWVDQEDLVIRQLVLERDEAVRIEVRYAADLEQPSVDAPAGSPPGLLEVVDGWRTALVSGNFESAASLVHPRLGPEWYAADLFEERSPGLLGMRLTECEVRSRPEVVKAHWVSWSDETSWESWTLYQYVDDKWWVVL